MPSASLCLLAVLYGCIIVAEFSANLEALTYCISESIVENCVPSASLCLLAVLYGCIIVAEFSANSEALTYCLYLDGLVG